MYLLNIVTSSASQPQNVGFGDWPAWLALVVALVSPVIHSLILTWHERKMFRINKDADKEKIIASFLSELVRIGSLTKSEYTEFSKESLQATQFMPKDCVKVLTRFISAINKYNNSTYHDDNTFAESNYYIFENPKNPKIFIESKYIDIVNYFIDHLK